MRRPAAITLEGIRVHNLQNVDVTIPLHQFTVITGVSGAGKSSLAFDTLYAEAQCRYLQSFSAYTRQFLERFDKPDADYISDLPPAVAIRPARVGNHRTTVGTMTQIVDSLRELFARMGTVVCFECGVEVHGQRVADVLETIKSHPAGAKVMIAFPGVPDGGLPEWLAALKEEGFVRLYLGGKVVRLEEALEHWPAIASPMVVVDRIEVGKTSVERITDSVETAWNRGMGAMALIVGDSVTKFDQDYRCPECGIHFAEPVPSLFDFNNPHGACPMCEGTGIMPSYSRKSKVRPCADCEGSRLCGEALYVYIGNKTIAEWCDTAAADLIEFLDANIAGSLSGTESVIVDQLRQRLSLLKNVNAGHLCLSQSATDLSSSESMRLRLATVMAAGMVNTLFVLEEPGAGLHPSETQSLIEALYRLRDAGNTVVAIEHHPDVIRAADRAVDLGPGAGEKGGHIVYHGPPNGLADCEESVTGAYLSGEQTCVKSRNRGATGYIHFANTEFPLGVLCVVAGPGHSGHRHFIERELYPSLSGTAKSSAKGADQIGQVVWMDQRPLPRSARSNAVTYIKAFAEIRKTFAAVAEAKIRNFGPGHFSFNRPGGRCERCEGEGRLTVDMQFLADVTTICPECEGTRYQAEVLAVKVRNLSIADVLELTVREAFRFFRSQVKVQKRLKWLLDVGLEYLRLGQSTETLSGGECQRLKLAGHLSSSRKSRSLFMLMEPSTGLHLADVEHLLECFHRLVDEGHSLIVVDNHSSLVAAADTVMEF